MKRVISLALALMLVLSLSCTAFAAVSPHNCKEHLGGDCICDKCGATIHTDANADGKCDHCNTAVSHVCEDKNADCKCDVCGKVYHYDGDKNNYCDNCGGQIKPVYALIVDGNPKTGDIIMTWVAVMGMAAAALFVVTKAYRKAR